MPSHVHHVTAILKFPRIFRILCQFSPLGPSWHLIFTSLKCVCALEFGGWCPCDRLLPVVGEQPPPPKKTVSISPYLEFPVRFVVATCRFYLAWWFLDICLCGLYNIDSLLFNPFHILTLLIDCIKHCKNVLHYISWKVMFKYANVAII